MLLFVGEMDNGKTEIGVKHVHNCTNGLKKNILPGGGTTAESDLPNLALLPLIVGSSRLDRVPHVGSRETVMGWL